MTELNYRNQSISYTNYMVPWIKNDISRYAAENKIDIETEFEYLKNNMIFVTFSFLDSYICNIKRNSDNCIGIGEIERKDFRHFYNLVCRETLGREYHKLPLTKKPLSFVCLDANGTRYWREMGEVNNIHIHSIWVLKPGTKDAFFKVREKVLSKPFVRFDQIHVEPFRVDCDFDQSLSKLISYTLKFDRFNQRDAEIADTLSIYPLTRPDPKYRIQ